MAENLIGKKSLPLFIGLAMVVASFANIQTNAALPAPGGVDTSIALWLDASNGVDEFEEEVNGWDDLSGNNNNGVPAGTGNLYWDDSSSNFNAGVYFDNAYFDIASDLGLGGANDFTVFSVSDTGSYSNPSTIVGPQSTGSGFQLRYFNVTPNIMSTFNTLILGGSNEVNSPTLLRASRSGNDFGLFNEGTANGSANSSYIFPTGNMSIGSSLDTEIFQGDINEVIVYNTALTQTQINQVETYLGLKYGFLLDGSINDYLNSAAASVYDVDDGAGDGTADDGTAEWVNVYGIGKDVNSGLDQRITKSMESYEEDEVEITLSTDTNLSSDGSNSERADNLSDGDYVVIGDDGSQPFFERDFGNGEGNMLGTTWKVQETGNPGTVYLELDGEFSYDSTTALVVSDDMNFDENDTIINLNPGMEPEGPGSSYIPAHYPVDFSNGVQYMTLIEIEPEVVVDNGAGIEINEGGQAGVFEVLLTTAPMEGDVYITVEADTEGVVNISPSSLTFDSDDWDIPQEVTVTAISDTDADDEAVELSFSVHGESSYEYFEVDSVTRNITVKDSENPDNDNDGDGMTNAEEDAAPNNGDANGDGTPDSSQTNVASSISDETGEYATIVLGGDCQGVADFQVVSESGLAAQDSENNFEVGLVDFDLTCPTPGQSADVTIIWDQQYDITNWRFRKFDGTSFIDIDDQVTYGTVNVGGVLKTTTSYTVTDGGPLDLDGLANGTIVDPAGPSTAAITTQDNTNYTEGSLIRTGGLGTIN